MNDEELWALESLGHFFLVRDRLDEARALFESLIAIAPERPYGWFGLGLIAVRDADTLAATQNFLNATRLGDDPRFGLALAESYIAAHDLKAAEPLLRRVAGDGSESGRRASALLRQWL